ncbi:MAG: hypothetical protein QOJ89_530 [bacterium]|jgi:hypothetical protein
MTLQNRVSPFGVFDADPARGTMMGNRGCLVNADGELVRRWQVERWITCVLEFKGRMRRPLMAPGHYTELFFLDEATACAAGHRPCHECRRADAERFLAAWATVHPRDTRLPEVDARLQRERTRDAHQRAVYAELPDGAIVSLDGRAWLVVDGGLRAWTPAGYTDHRASPVRPVTVLTPPSTLAAMRAGWRPGVHLSARP